ncbi:hypothetical protein GWI33_019826 [Rhynchophorus ferrugineus]|uniref:Uncharacterized protein n=1 Tax=Rhynchophorus ferrugineus TaxID=354439 RepID=A0A834HQP5_RHYFE|nr:hypothetical protein GWI33_019826 [Rhynchophorus ferrugineus]
MFCVSVRLENVRLIKIHLFIDLGRLRRTCRRFRDIINCWDKIFLKTTTIVSNQNSEKFLTRCFSIIPTKLEKLRLQHNWKHGIYIEKSMFPIRKKYMPWIRIDKENLWFSRGHRIFNYKRNKENIIKSKPNYVLTPKYPRNYSGSGISTFDVTRFTISKDILVGGLSDGGVYIQNLEKNFDFYIDKTDNTYTSSVDISPDHIMVASGMRNDCFKIYAVRPDPIGLTHIHTQELGQRVWCVSYCQDKPLFACGTTAGGPFKKSIWLYDTERYSEILNMKLGHYISSTFDMKWDGPNCLWTCGNDSYLRRWDLRTGQCEQKYHDLFGYSLYCLDYDYFNSIMVGTYLHGRIALWDIRAEKCVQFYFMHGAGGNAINSPVYSLSFDSEYLFAALDQYLNILDFGAYGNRGKHDYIKMFSK